MVLIIQGWSSTERLRLQLITYDSRFAFFFKQVDNHNHSEDDIDILRNEVVSRMRLKILEDPTRPIRRVFNETIAINTSDDEDENLLECIPDFGQVRSSFSRSKRKCFPSIPRRVQDVPQMAENLEFKRLLGASRHGHWPPYFHVTKVCRKVAAMFRHIYWWDIFNLSKTFQTVNYHTWQIWQPYFAFPLSPFVCS